MKKLLAIVLVLLMCVTLFACNNEEKDPPASGSPTTSTPPAVEPSDEPSGTQGTDSDDILDQIGVFDPDYDYSANPKYKISYVVNATGALYEAFGTAFAHWSSVMNLEYLGLIDFAGDVDQYLNQLPTIAADNDGLLIDPDSQTYNRCAEILNEIGIPWMGCMAEARDYEGTGYLLNAYVGFVQKDVGVRMPSKLLEFKEELWADVPLSEFGAICVDYSVAAPLHEREVGFKEELQRVAPEIFENDHYFVADTAISMFDIETSQTVVSQVLAANPTIEHWLIFGEVDDMAQGAALAIDQAGLTDTTAIVTFGGTALQVQWDAGQQDAWRAALYLPQTIFAEPIIGALYAFMSGQATPETIWPEWVNKNETFEEGKQYATRLLPTYWIEYDNYQHMIRWSDVYSQSDFFPDYPTDGITRDSYSTALVVPDYYK